MTTQPPLWPHQQTVIEASLETLYRSTGCMLALPMGTGKSRIATEVLERLGARRVVIVGPKTVCVDAWPEQLRRWSRYGLIDCYTGPVRERVLRLRQRRQPGRPRAVVVNYDVIAKEPMRDALMRWLPDAIVLDESHRIASPGTKRSRAARRIAAVARYRLALSGTPISTALGPLGIWSQFRALDPAIYEEPTYGRFMARYTGPVERGKHHGVHAGRGGALTYWRYRNLPQLKSRMRLLAHRVRAEDVLDLPGEMDRTLAVVLTAKAMKAYRELNRHLVAELEGGTVTTPMALTRSLRLQQLTGGHLPLDDGPLERVCHAKERALTDVIRDDAPNERVVVMAQFHADLDVIGSVARTQRRGRYELSGRRNQLAAWRRDPRGVLAVQIQAGSEGIDLTASRHCVWYSTGFSLVAYAQARARLHRPGQTLPVIHTHLVATDPDSDNDLIDETVVKALGARANVAAAVLAGVRAIR